jgi:hypothetical protein
MAIGRTKLDIYIFIGYTYGRMLLPEKQMGETYDMAKQIAF